jgi:hypothetical protein
MNETDCEYVILEKGKESVGRNLSLDPASMIKYVDKNE